MSVVKRVSYFGSDPDFSHELDAYIKNDGIRDFAVIKHTYSRGALIEICAKRFQDIVFIDISTIDKVEELIQEVLFIKRHSLLKKTLFVAEFANQSSLNENKNLLTSGFQLFFIKGTESKSFIRDSFYIAFGDNSEFKALTCAIKIDKEAWPSAYTTVSTIENNQIKIETDLDFSCTKFELKLPIFPDLRCDRFFFKDKNIQAPRFDMLNSMMLELPICDPHLESSSETLSESTLEAWKSLNSNLLKPVPINIKIISENTSLMNDLYSTFDPSLVNLSFQHDMNEEVFQEDFSRFEFPLIFFDLEITPGGKNHLSELEALVNCAITSSGIKPIIISTKNPSQSGAIQKLLNYSNILCDSNWLTAKVYTTLVQNYLKKKVGDEAPQKYLLPLNFPMRTLDVKFEVQITSLTEHEITFYSTMDIPMFTLLHFDLPINFVATVVPPLYELSNRPNSQQYMAFINGVDERDIEILRKFVNQIIYKPLPDFSAETISSVLNHLQAGKAEIEIAPAVNPVTLIKKTEISKQDFFKENRAKGKSKL